VGSDGARHRPVMIHRGVLSSMERMAAHLIERYEGAFPPWLAPVQVLVLPVAEQHAAAASQVADRIRAAGLRAECDPADATLGARIHQARARRIPYVAVIGDRETATARRAAANRPDACGPSADAQVSLRLRDGRQLDAVPVTRLISEASRQIADRSPALGFD